MRVKILNNNGYVGLTAIEKTVPATMTSDEHFFILGKYLGNKRDFDPNFRFFFPKNTVKIIITKKRKSKNSHLGGGAGE